MSDVPIPTPAPEPQEREYEPPRAEDVSADEPMATATGFVT